MLMRSLTVFDPEKVFTEVIKILPCGYATWMDSPTYKLPRHSYKPALGICKHIKFFFTKDSLCTYL